MLGHAAGLLFFFRERRRRYLLGGVGGLLLVAFVGGGRVEVGDVVLEGETLDGLAGREFRWGGALAGWERGRRGGVVGH